MSEIKLEDLKTNMCRWPIGDPKNEEFHFCGKLKASGVPYCRHHEEMAYRSDARSSAANVEKKAA